MSGIQLRRGPMFPALREDFEDLLNWARQMERPFIRGRGLWFPIDVLETPDDYVITAEIPGVSRDNIDVNLDRNVLTIKIGKTLPAVAENASYHIREREQGEFSRSVALPEAIDVNQVSASYNEGVLEVRIVKAEESKPRRVEITGS
ncbi:MAG TPA: Hsp20/alpha crystallin family protein [Armatimonadota bacterium]|nr:Hsp20/alpha crystallin family protein [Armatimonadota bacterium]